MIKPYIIREELMNLGWSAKTEYEINFYHLPHFKLMIF